MAKGMSPLFGWNNRSMFTVPVAPSKTASGFQALRALQTKCVQAASKATPVGSSTYPNGKKVRKVT